MRSKSILTHAMLGKTLCSAVALAWLCRGQKPAGLHLTSSYFPDTSECRRQSEREIDRWIEREKEKRLPALVSPRPARLSVTLVNTSLPSSLLPPHPPTQPSFLTPACLCAVPVYLYCFPLFPSFSFSATLWGGQEVEERGWRKGQLVRMRVRKRSHSIAN